MKTYKQNKKKNLVKHQESFVAFSPPLVLFCPQSTVVVEKSIQDLMNLMQDLSAYSNQFLEMICDKLKEYKDICNTAYRYDLEKSHLAVKD